MAPLPQIPINDKLLHFIGMGVASFGIYWVVDVDEIEDGVEMGRSNEYRLVAQVGLVDEHVPPTEGVDPSLTNTSNHELHGYSHRSGHDNGDVNSEAGEWTKYTRYRQYVPEILVIVFGLGVGGILSEIVQGMLPYKTFQWGDIVVSQIFLFFPGSAFPCRRRRLSPKSLLLLRFGNGHITSTNDNVTFLECVITLEIY